MRFVLLLSLLNGLFTFTLYAQTELIAPTLTDSDLIEYLQNNYTATSPKNYNSARDAMYSSIDNQNGNIIGIYTGFTVTASSRGEAFSKGINTEHTWPQSFYDKDEPMRGDIHHLFPTRIEANSARSNLPFDEIPDNSTDTWYYMNNQQNSIPSSNIDLYSELDAGSRFEPREDHKGNTARAIFYFWTIYQNSASIVNDGTDNQAFFNSMKDVLLNWHQLDPADQSEIERSNAIESVQGNRNPFVHDSTLVRRAYFGGQPISNEHEDKKLTFSLEQNYPNPFNPSTTISFTIQSVTDVKLEVYNILGKKVSTLVNARLTEGTYTKNFDATQLSSGVYLYRLYSGDQLLTRKMTLIK